MRLRSATVTPTSGGFSVRAVMEDDNADGSLPNSYRRWWHFEVGNFPAAGTTLDVRVENAGYGDVILPVWRLSANGGTSYDGWRRLPTSSLPMVAGSTHRFPVVVPAGTTHLQLAKFFPYPVSEKDDLLTRIGGHRLVRSIHSIGSSSQGRPIELVTLTDSSVPDAGKHRVWVHAAVHPAETTAPLMAEGLIDYLLGGSSRAEQLMDELIVEIVPLANPDGTALGNYRTTANSVNLEEQWAAPYSSTVPEVAALRTAIEQRMGTPAQPAPQPIEVLLNLHSSHNVSYPFHFRHVSNPSFDLVTSRSGVIPAVHQLEQDWIDALVLESPFVARGTTQNSTVGAPIRPFVESMMHDRWSIDPRWTGQPVMAITLEGTYGRGPDGVNWATRQDHIDVGAAIGRALGRFFQLPTGSFTRPFGTGCGAAVLSGGFQTNPERFPLLGVQLPGAQPAVLVLGLDRITSPLPGLSPCPLRTTPVIALGGSTQTFGIWNGVLPVPVGTGDLGVNAQLLVLDPNATGLTATNGLELRVVR